MTQNFLYLCLGLVEGIFGGLFGAKIAAKLSNLLLERIFGIALLLISLKMIFVK